MWFIKWGGTSGLSMVCMVVEVENRFVMAHDKTNGPWELRVRGTIGGM